jgi:predicted O-methyltransferase YrrM
MKDFFHSLVSWVRYRGKALSKHGVHSPFVFSFVTEVLNDRTRFPEYREIEALRTLLEKDNTMLQRTDLGAGSRRSSRQSVAAIARISLQSPRYAQLLFRLARYFKPGNIIELGTSLGISALYLAKALPGTEVYTVEGDPMVADRAEALFDQAGAGNILLVRGNFDDVLPGLRGKGVTPGLVYIDGNHTRAATLRYFYQLLPQTDENSILVFDDIYWSKEMTGAWEEIYRHPSVQYSIDLFRIGIVFFRPARVKQHFILKF